MFVILKDEKTVVAADKEFLEKTGVESLYLLGELFRVGEFSLDAGAETLTVAGEALSYIQTPLQTWGGDAVLYDFDLSANAMASRETETPDETVNNQLTRSVPGIQNEEAPAVPGKRAVSENPEEALPLTREEEELPPATNKEQADEDFLTLSGAAAATGILLSAQDSESTRNKTEEERSPDSPDVQTPSALPEEEPESPAPATIPAPETEETSGYEILDLKEESSEDIRTQSLQPEHSAEDEKGNDETLEIIGLQTDDLERQNLQPEHSAEETEEEDETQKVTGLKEETLEQSETPDLPLASIPDEEPPSTDDSVIPEDEGFELIDLKEPDTDIGEPDSSSSETDADLHLAVPSSTEEPEASAEDNTAKTQSDTAPTSSVSLNPFADYQQNAQLIGISHEDYLAFLAQFVEESEEKITDLRGTDLRSFQERLLTLKDASQLLHLPKLTAKLHQIETTSPETRGELIDDLHAMIDHIREDLGEVLASEVIRKETAETEKPGEKPLTGIVPPEKEQAKPEERSVETVLEAIQPIPFDFSANVAAEELGLPEPLVEEFVIDFVRQAKENIPLFQSAQKEGKLETIQKTAHLLKGAASNLRIDPLAKTLEELQYNEDMDKVEAIFHRFVGQLKALENFLRVSGA